MDEYYKIPDWLKGNAWETLESEGNFTIFLAGVEKSGFMDLVNGTGIVTVIAPTDSAFQAYLTNKGYNSINDMPIDELKKVITYHLVYYSFEKQKFINYQPTPAGAPIDPLDRGIYYKHRTKSRSEISYIPDPTENNRLRKVFHKERFLPVFSFEIFKTKGIDAKSNYEFFYPNSTWTGGTDGFNISNASVKKYAVVTDNGYIYEVNQVLEPLETIYSELEKDNNFSIFKDMYNRFAEFYFDQATTSAYGQGSDDSLFLHYHTELPSIASEWTYNGEGSLPDYANLGTLSRRAFNVFAPENSALQDFFNTFWAGYYPSINDVNFFPIGFLIYNHVNDGNILFPEEIESGEIKSYYGNPIVFERNAAVKKQMCVNGTLYGLDKVLVPPMFTSVTGPAFQDPKYKMFLIMMANAGMIFPLMSDQVTFKLFLPSDSMLLNDFTTVRGKELNFIDNNPKKFGEQIVQIMGDADFVTMNYYQKLEVVQNHIAVGNPITIQGTQEVYRTMSPYNYILIRNDSAFSSLIYNRNMTGTPFAEIPGTRTNGKTYALQGETTHSALTIENLIFKTIMNPASLLHPADFSEFKSKFLAKTNFASSNYNFLQGEQFIVFVPSNDNSAIMDTIQTANATEMAKYYFVRVKSSSLNDYPFAGAGIQGELITFKSDGTGGFKKLTLIDTGSGLQVRDEKNNTVNVIGLFPRIYEDGAAYIIDGMLNYE